MSTVSSSRNVERGFCGRCGTALTYSHALRPDEIDVTLASLEDPALVVPTAHIWVQDKLPWIHIEDDLPRYRTALGAGD